jgi:hypothetical protein
MESEITSEQYQIRVAPEVLEVTKTQIDGLLQGCEGGVRLAEQRVTTSEIVPGHWFVGEQADEAPIDLEGTSIVSARGEVMPVGTQDDRVEGVAFQQASEELQLEVELALFAEPACRRFGKRTLAWGLAWQVT